MDYNNGSIFLICQKAKGRKIPGFITLSLFGWAVAPLKTVPAPRLWWSGLSGEEVVLEKRLVKYSSSC